MTQSDPPPDGVDDPDMGDVFEDLEELEALVDSTEERERVRETMRTLHHAREQSRFGRLKGAFGTRDAGEALVGSFLFGIPMIVEDGTLAAGRYIAQRPLFFGLTVVFGVTLTVGILHAAGFEDIEADRLFGIVPVRLLGVLVIAVGMAFGLLTLWGRIDWTNPWIATGQSTVTAMVMAVGAALGDILPE